MIFNREYDRTIEAGSQIVIDGHRKLQFKGERCDPNVFDVALENPLLSTFVELLDAADLEDLFLCAGMFRFLLSHCFFVASSSIISLTSIFHV